MNRIAALACSAIIACAQVVPSAHAAPPAPDEAEDIAATCDTAVSIATWVTVSRRSGMPLAQVRARVTADFFEGMSNPRLADRPPEFVAFILSIVNRAIDAGWNAPEPADASRAETDCRAYVRGSIPRLRALVNPGSR